MSSEEKLSFLPLVPNDEIKCKVDIDDDCVEIMKFNNITFAEISEGGFDYKKVYLYAAEYQGILRYGIGGTPDLAKHDALNKIANVDHLLRKQEDYLQYFSEDFNQENVDIKIDDKCVIEENGPDGKCNGLCEF